MSNNFTEGSCMDCGKTFYEQVDETAAKSYAYFVCPDCQFEYVDLVCPKCENCDFIDDLASRPLSWTCDKCDTVVEFEPDLYNHPEKLYRFEELPPEVQYEFEKAKIKAKNHTRLIFAYMLIPPVILLIVFLMEKFKN